MLFRQFLLQEELHRHQLQYERLVVQVVSDVNDIMIDSVLLEITTIQKELETIWQRHSNPNLHILAPK